MNSATSTDPQPLQPWQFFTLAGLVGATIVVFVSEGQTPAGIILLSLIIFGAAAVGAAAWRTFSPLSGLDEPTGPQMFGGRTRAALEREKSLVLRSIKDLEFDHAMGKVSDKDFSEMGARLRARAAGLLRQLDAGTSYRQAIETEIEKRVGKAAPAVAAPAVAAPARPAAAPAAASDKAKTKLCLSCCTPNDPDARFCKGCGYQLGDW
jgi:ribosomal protein L40E